MIRKSISHIPKYASPMTDEVSVSFQPSTDNGTTAIEKCNGQYLRGQQSCTRQEPTYQHDDQCLIAFKQERLHLPKWQIWNRRPILQEMDTQEYDWVRLYTEKSPAKPFYSIAGDSAREIYLCFNKKTRSKLDFDRISRSFNSILFDSFYSISNAF